MARPHEESLNYFPLDTEMDDDVKILEAQYGIEGFGILVRIWQKIYSGEGYYTEWKMDIAKIFCRENALDYDKTNSVVETCLELGIFNENLFEEYNILTSKAIQKRYMKATSRRTRIEIDSRYLVLDEDMINKNTVIVNKNKVNEHKNLGSSQQSKVKESKENNKPSQNESETLSREDLVEEYGKAPVKANEFLIDKIKNYDSKTPIPDYGTKKMERWVQSMDRLNRLGAKGGDEGFEWKTIRSIIEWIFSDEEGNSNFSWADQVESSTGLRDKISSIHKQWKKNKPDDNPEVTGPTKNGAVI